MFINQSANYTSHLEFKSLFKLPITCLSRSACHRSHNGHYAGTCTTNKNCMNIWIISLQWDLDNTMCSVGGCWMGKKTKMPQLKTFASHVNSTLPYSNSCKQPVCQEQCSQCSLSAVWKPTCIEINETRQLSFHYNVLLRILTGPRLWFLCSARQCFWSRQGSNPYLTMQLHRWNLYKTSKHEVISR